MFLEKFPQDTSLLSSAPLLIYLKKSDLYKFLTLN